MSMSNQPLLLRLLYWPLLYCTGVEDPPLLPPKTFRVTDGSESPNRAEGPIPERELSLTPV